MRHFPKTINGQEIPVRTNTDSISYQDTGNQNKITLTEKLDSVNNKCKNLVRLEESGSISFDSENYDQNKLYKKFTILKHHGQTFMSKSDVTGIEPKENKDNWLHLSPRRSGECLIYEKWIPKTHILESDFGYTYDDLSNMLKNNDYHRYIQNGDYIKIDTPDFTMKLLLNIDTYYNTRGTHPHCIDLICTEIIPTPANSTKPADRYYQIDTNIATNWAINNGETPIVLANFFTGDNNWIMNSAIQNLTQAAGYLSDRFRTHIVDKYKNTVIRKIDKTDSTGLNKTDYTTREVSLGKLWLLYEGEIKTSPSLSSPADMMTCCQYPIFQKYENRVFKLGNTYCGILTSSLLNKGMTNSKYHYSNDDLNPIMIRHNISEVYTDAVKNRVFPMFGMRFV